jgi:acyl carrier protein
MDRLPYLSIIFLILISLTLLASIIWRLLFKRGSRGNVPRPEKVRRHVLNLDYESKEIINDLKTQYKSVLSEDEFSTLCLATALTIEQPLLQLKNHITLAEYIDSLSHVEFIMLLEKLFGIEISDEEASKILTFKVLLNYVESRIIANK